MKKGWHAETLCARHSQIYNPSISVVIGKFESSDANTSFRETYFWWYGLAGSSMRLKKQMKTHFVGLQVLCRAIRNEWCTLPIAPEWKPSHTHTHISPFCLSGVINGTGVLCFPLRLWRMLHITLSISGDASTATIFDVWSSTALFNYYD